MYQITWGRSVWGMLGDDVGNYWKLFVIICTLREAIEIDSGTHIHWSDPRQLRMHFMCYFVPPRKYGSEEWGKTLLTHFRAGGRMRVLFEQSSFERCRWSIKCAETKEKNNKGKIPCPSIVSCSAFFAHLLSYSLTLSEKSLCHEISHGI